MHYAAITRDTGISFIFCQSINCSKIYSRFNLMLFILELEINYKVLRRALKVNVKYLRQH